MFSYIYSAYLQRMNTVHIYKEWILDKKTTVLLSAPVMHVYISVHIILKKSCYKTGIYCIQINNAISTNCLRNSISMMLNWVKCL